MAWAFALFLFLRCGCVCVCGPVCVVCAVCTRAQVTTSWSTDLFLPLLVSSTHRVLPFFPTLRPASNNNRQEHRAHPPPSEPSQASYVSKDKDNNNKIQPTMGNAFSAVSTSAIASLLVLGLAAFAAVGGSNSPAKSARKLSGRTHSYVLCFSRGLSSIDTHVVFSLQKNKKHHQKNMKKKTVSHHRQRTRSCAGSRCPGKWRPSTRS